MSDFKILLLGVNMIRSALLYHRSTAADHCKSGCISTREFGPLGLTWRYTRPAPSVANAENASYIQRPSNVFRIVLWLEPFFPSFQPLIYRHASDVPSQA